MAEASLETIREWLVEGTDNPETLVDLRWTVLEETRDSEGLASLRVSHPRLPVSLLVLRVPTLKDVPVARLVIETGVETVDMEPAAKLRLYRRLLETSKLPLAKYYLYGDSDTIGIAVDLDLRSLSKEEFNDALLTLFLAYLYLRKMSSSLEELIKRQELTVLGMLVANYIERGMSREEVIRYLVNSGLSEETARDIVDTVFHLASNRRDLGMFI